MRRFAVILSFFFCLSSFAQVDHVITHIESSDDLANTIIQCFCRDHEGFLWVGTHDGLFRYDGYHFQGFYNDPDDTCSISGNNVKSILEDKDHHLWIGTSRGLNLFNRQRQQFARRIARNLMDENINQLSEDANGFIWIGTGKGLYSFYPEKKTFTFYQHNKNDSSILENEVTSVFRDKNDELWVATWASGLNKFNKDKKTFEHFTPAQGMQGYISCIAQDNEGILWIGSFYNGLARFDAKNRTLRYVRQDIFGQNHITSISKDKKGNLWVTAMTKGLIKLNPATEETVVFTDKETGGNKLSNINNFSLFVDYQDILWIGSVDKGIDAIYNYPRESRMLNLPQRIRQELYISDIACDLKGNLWFLSEEQIYQYHNADNSNAISSYRTDKYSYLYIDRSGQVWNYKSSCRLFNEKQNAFAESPFITAPYNFKGSEIRNIYETANHSRWQITDKQIIVQAHGSSKTQDLTSTFISAKIHPSSIHHIFEDSRGIIWIAHPDLDIYNPKSGRIIHINKDIKVNDITEDKDGKVWISSSGGIYNFDHQAKTISLFSQKFSDAYSIVFHDDALWVSTQKGLKIFDLKKQQLRKVDVIKMLGSWHYNLAQSSKTIFISGGSDILAVNADSFYNPYVPNVFLTKLMLFNNEVLINENSLLNKYIGYETHLTFAHKQSDISFEFAALNLLLPENNKYAYRLEGFDNDWRYASKNRIASYMNLPPGDYRFCIKASNNDGVWNEKITTLNITILPAWWQTWWFRLILFFVFFICVLLIIRYRTHKIIQRNIELESLVTERTKKVEEQKEELEKQADFLQEINQQLTERQEELEAMTEELKMQSEQLFDTNKNLQKINATKDKLFSIIAHDLKNPFQAILSSTDNLAKKYTQINDDKRMEHIGAIKQSSTSAYNLLENLLHWARSQTNSIDIHCESTDICELAEATIQLFKVTASNKNIAIVSDVPKKTLAFVDRNMLTTVIRNLVGNALKFSYAGGKIEISGVQDRDETQISITDTGVGMEKEAVKKLFQVSTHHSTFGTMGESGTGLGLIICKEFIEKNNGTISVKSQPGIGTTFIITLPSQENIKIKHEKNEQKEVKEDIHKVSSVAFKSTINNVSIDSQISGARILIVDDNPNIRENLKQSLSEFFEIYEASNGKEGLSIALEMTPDLIISDVMMPEMDGFELCQQIKTNESTSHIPIILLTVRSSDNSRVKGIETGADDYVTKPFNMDYMLARIENLISSRNEMKKRFAKEITLEPKDIVITSLDEQFLSKAMAVVEKNLADSEFDSNELVAAMNMSRSGLFLKLKALTGQSATEFIRTIRLKRAAQMLTQRGMTVSQVCYAVGFKNPVYFSRSFSKQFGMPPSDYSEKMSAE